MRPHTDDPFFDILYTCRAMRRLRPDPVPEEVLLQLVDAALQGPSGSNAQNWTFIIVRDRACKEKIAALWKPTWDFYLETFGQMGMDQASPKEKAAKQGLLKAATYMVNHMAETPAIIFAGVRRDATVNELMTSPSTWTSMVSHLGLAGTARFIASGITGAGIADGSTAYPAVQNLLLAARALGLGAVLTTPQFFIPGKFEALLGIPSNVTLAAIIPVGYPMGKFGPTRRPAPQAVVHWDGYQEKN